MAQQCSGNGKTKWGRGERNGHVQEEGERDRSMTSPSDLPLVSSDHSLARLNVIDILEPPERALTTGLNICACRVIVSIQTIKSGRNNFLFFVR